MLLLEFILSYDDFIEGLYLDLELDDNVGCVFGNE